MGPRFGGYRRGVGTFRLVHGSGRERGSGGLCVARRKRSTGRERWRARPRRFLRAGRARAGRVVGGDYPRPLPLRPLLQLPRLRRAGQCARLDLRPADHGRQRQYEPVPSCFTWRAGLLHGARRVHTRTGPARGEHPLRGPGEVGPGRNAHLPGSTCRGRPATRAATWAIQR